MKKITILILIIFSITTQIYAQTELENSSSEAEVTDTTTSENLTRAQRLDSLANTIDEETKELNRLKRQLLDNGDDVALQSSIDNTSAQLESIKKSFEQLAINNIDTQIFEISTEPTTWQEELLIVVKPLLENIRGLTEEPRKKEELRQELVTQTSALETASKALDSINQILNSDSIDSETKVSLTTVQTKWQRVLEDSQIKLELAQSSLDIINQTNIHWFDDFKESFGSFAKNRGFTLLLALASTVLVILFFRLLGNLIEKRRKKRSSLIKPTYYRIIAYSQRLLTILFIVLAVMLVFFIRGDVLLVALMCVLIFIFALALKNVIPSFLQESRILLNIGRVRENELVTYNGIPWRIASLNIFTKLVNPELKGILRLPLEEIKQLSSRPISDEKWFPSSIGDWVLDSETDRIYEVITQGPDSVEIQSAQGTNKLIPSADYYNAGFVNLTRSKGLRITSIFGVDYNLQSICLEEIPKKMEKAIQDYLENSGLSYKELSTRVEFKTANASSLDYLIIVNVGSEAAPSYYRIERYIQQACVQLCNKEGWNIPFPQLTINKL